MTTLVITYQSTGPTVTRLLTRKIVCWNRQDVDHYTELYSNDPTVLVIDEEEE